MTLMSLALASTAKADELRDDEEVASRAESHYQMAVRFFGEGRYREAVDEFDRAIGLIPEAIFFCNRAVSLIKLDEMDAALRSMTECLERFEGDEDELAQIEAQTRALEVVRLIRLDAAAVARDMAFGGSRLVDSQESPRGPVHGLALLGYSGVGTGAALLAGALVLDLASADLKNQYLAQSRGGNGTSEQAHGELADRLRGRQRVFYGLLSAGAVATVIGGGLLTYHYVTVPSSSLMTLHVAPVIGAGQVILGLGGSF
jgi:tetratricopeptide (TPR) repeat protein